MFKVNNKDTRTTPSTPCSSVSVNNFEHVIAGWGGAIQFLTILNKFLPQHLLTS